MPVFFSIGNIHIYSLSVALVVGWLVFSFLFWRGLRSEGVPEERIFDLTFFSTIWAFIFARGGFVLVNFTLFAPNLLKIAAIWITPGLSLYGAILGELLTLVYLSRRYKVRLGIVLDAWAGAFGWSYIIGAVGALLDGSYVGLPTTFPWGIRYVGYIGARHPVQVYEILAMILVLIITLILRRRAARDRWPYGLLGLWFIALFTVFEFILEFFKDSRVYLTSLRANQWVLIALFAETMGAFYVRGGGRELVRPFLNKIRGGTYGKFSK